ncbi:GAF domain-containing protein [Mycolicibacterium goodii]|uniref:GAF domain-containing protein n=1 Tax=Mycolicibacterium goodii TaxID=134601 RepID=UPI0009388934|nr:GAF domain-containing protein [Mycolicibacterium goodii]OKH74653.1 histidine kinase [Mycobacterium sp. SWH-M5]PJK18623.1 GAF domain-containing protein [Mycolicibacterium goodii]ULN51138.2 GAF domain-containing protein [Mycolicibacterium goodii]
MSGHGGIDTAQIEAALAELVRASADPDPYVILARITMAAVDELPAVHHAGVTLLGEQGVIRSLAATNGHPLVLDNIQRQCGDGPAFTAALDPEFTLIDDLNGETRWPSFTARAVAATPIRSMLQLPLSGHGTASATLNLYSNRAGIFGDDTVAAGLVIAKSASQIFEVRRSRRRSRKATTRPVTDKARIPLPRHHLDAVAVIESRRSVPRHIRAQHDCA